MKAATIKREIRELRRAMEPLHGDIAADQCYGAMEALRWVLGDGPRPYGLARPLGIKREQNPALP